MRALFVAIIIGTTWLVVVQGFKPKEIVTTKPTKRRCVANSTNHQYAGRVAIGITGVSRGLHYTLPSIEKHVFQVLTRHNFDYDVLWSTVSNPEFNGQPMDEYEFAKMRPCLFSITSQEVVRYSQWKKFCDVRGFTCREGLIRNVAGKVYGPGGQMYTRHDRRHFGKYIGPRNSQFRNYLCAFDSQSRLANLIRMRARKYRFEYNAVIVIRPDVAFIRDIDFSEHFSQIALNPWSVWIPDFQEFRGLNDRAAFGSQIVMLKYLERGDVFMSNNSYHFSIAEEYMARYVRDNGIKVEKSSMRFMRIRPVTINGHETPMIEGFDIDPEQMGVSADDADLLRCAGTKFYPFQNTKVKRLSYLKC